MMRGMGKCSRWPYACESPASLLSSADVLCVCVCVCVFVCVLCVFVCVCVCVCVVCACFSLNLNMLHVYAMYITLH